MHSILTVCSLVVMFALHSQGKILSRDDQIRLLRNNDIPEIEMEDWLCIIEHESEGDTKAMNKENEDDSWDWGLFQINDQYWCGRYGVDKGCNVDCSTLLTDLNAAVKCAKEIKRAEGFKAWVAWNKYCQHLHQRGSSMMGAASNKYC